jgi:hypothetical protein
MEKYIEIINDIEQIRNNVNVSSMSFLKMLYSVDEKSADFYMAKISDCDNRIQSLSEMLHMKKKRSDSEILDEIESIRAENNKNWMDVVRMCFELDPERARTLFYKIKECDKRIQSSYVEIRNNETH